MQHHDAGLFAWIAAVAGLIASVMPYLETGLRIVALLLSIAASWYAIKYYQKD